MLGQEHEVMLKAARVALIWNASNEARIRGADYRPFAERLEKALNELVDAQMDLEIFKKDQDDSKN